MSRIGRKPIAIPQGVQVSIDNGTVVVKGPKGSLDCRIHPAITVSISDGMIKFERKDDLPKTRALHGTMRALVNNMIIGVTSGYKKELEIHGIGYKAELRGNKLTLNVSKSHPVVYEVPQNVKIEVPAPDRIVVSGIDKEAVGQVAAEIRAIDPPEPYKGKGIRYVGEHVRRKAGKAGAAQA